MYKILKRFEKKTFVKKIKNMCKFRSSASADINIGGCNLPRDHVQNVKSTTIRHAAVRKTGVYRYRRGPIESPPETSRIS